MLGEGLGVMCKVTGRLGIECRDVIDAESLEECRESDPPHRVDAIEGYTEVRSTDSFDVDSW